MKCGMTLISRTNRRGKSRVHHCHSGDVVSTCDGNIQAVIMAKDEPYLGGCSSVLSVEWRCDTCGLSHGHPELPTSEEGLSKFITELLNNAPDDLLEGMRATHMEMILGHESRMQEWLAAEAERQSRRGKLPKDPPKMDGA